MPIARNLALAAAFAALVSTETGDGETIHSCSVVSLMEK
jgi:hypothetical protein